MKEEITISELARIMNVSVHQIRYFEEKEILHPAYTDDNSYRMYCMDQVYELAQILLLRRLGVSVPSIKQSLASFTEGQYEELLHHSLLETTAQMEKLQKHQQFISKVLQEQQNSTGQTEQYQVKQRKVVFLTRWIEMEPHTTLHARLLAEQAAHPPNLFETDIHYLYDSSNAITICLEAEQPNDFVLSAGDYLSSHFLLEHENELDQWIERFHEHAAAHSYVLAEPLILIEKSYLSLFSQGTLHYEILKRIESKDEAREGAQDDYHADYN
ncbi:MerR family transcriptional regulator [Paenibacillus donghaensis]|uniref:Transcriptional regulator n=1 Tax=Paenibacillus donghaensis TaxID=414771 RepID=A0A2Z2KYT2_9BACL|nr:MerR family transcriptional regulator [Paenibacillus donghaensis]ASA25808.1 transcriptional regulator [Paenibacillus donghaensis]